MKLDLFPRPKRVDLTGEFTTLGDLTMIRRSGLPEQGYRIRIAPDGSLLGEASCDAGERYARLMAEQLGGLSEKRARAGVIEDFPDFRVRGVMLDISRGKVPRLTNLKTIIDKLSKLKFNHVQLYMEHTFAYSCHENVHRKSGAYTPDDIAELTEFCRMRGIELAPNQNCLGHMERWLCHADYAALALEPAGSVNSLGIRRPPMTLDPANPKSFELVAGLIRELVPCFDTRHVHVGLDETWELPSKRLPELRDWAARLRKLPELRGKEMLVWADMFLQRPELLRTLDDHIIFCEWGYEANHPFPERARLLAESQVPFWVCPGTSSWLSIAGRWPNARANCLAAALAGKSNNADGFLLTDWGDNGHLQPWPVSEPAVVASAGFAWGSEENQNAAIDQPLSQVAYGISDVGLGRAVRRLGSLSALVTPQPSNMSALLVGLYYPWMRAGHGLTDGLTLDELDSVSASISAAAAEIEETCSLPDEFAISRDEICWVAEVMQMLVRDLSHRLRGDGTLGSIPRSVRMDLADQCVELVSRHCALWLQRNRKQGLGESAKWLETLANCYTRGYVTTERPPRSI